MTAERQAFPARTEVLPRVSAFIEERCSALGAGRDTTLLMLLLAEELFINTVVHGYREDGRRRVHLHVRDAGPEIELVAEDNAPAFNPFQGVPGGKLTANQPVGGYGRRLVVGLSSRHTYERRGRLNRVTVGLPKNRA